MQIRLSSVLLAALLGVALVAGLIAFSPALTRTYYVQLAALILGAGACVTIYNRISARRARRYARCSAEPLWNPPVHAYFFADRDGVIFS